MVRKGFGLGASGRRRIDCGLFGIDITYTPDTPRRARKPIGEEVKRVVTCPHCGLVQAVFGLAVWCSDCGRDIFMAHVAAEHEIIRKILADTSRRQEIDQRIASRDVENCLEDTVSIFEAVMKALTVRFLRQAKSTEEEIGRAMKRLGNSYQSISRSRDAVQSVMAIPLSAEPDQTFLDELAAIFEKRHPITHNLGVVDRKYIERALSAEQEGREIRVTAGEVERALSTSMDVMSDIHARLFPNSGSAPEEEAQQEVQD